MKTKEPEEDPSRPKKAVKAFKVYSDCEKMNGRTKPSNGIREVAKMPPLPPWKPALGNLTTGRLNGNDVVLKKSAGMQVQAKTGRRALADVTNTRACPLSHQPNNAPKLMNGKTGNGCLSQGKIRTRSRSFHGKELVGSKALLSKSHKGKATVSNTKSGRGPKNEMNQLQLRRRIDIAKFKIYCDNGNAMAGTSGKSATAIMKTNTRSFGSIKLTGRIPKKNNNDIFASGSVATKQQRKVLVKVSSSVRPLQLRKCFGEGYKILNKPTKTKSVLPSKIPKDKASSKPRNLLLRQKLPTVQASSRAPAVSARKATCPSSKIVEARMSNRTLTSRGNSAVPAIDGSFRKKQDITCESNSVFRSDNVTAIISKFKQTRRRSYTYLLVEGFKSQLPSIDDSRNHLEVPVYVNDIYQYYWTMEAQSPSLVNYMTLQPEITSEMRGILVNWLIEVHLKFELMQESLFLMLQLVDKFLSSHQIRKDELQLVGITALLLASKYEDYWHPKIKDLLSISAEVYTRDQVLSMEKLILKKLKYRLNFPTLYVFMLRFLKAAQADKKLEHLAFYLVELCLVEYDTLGYKPSLVCASALYVARCTQTLTPTWTDLLIRHTHYQECQLKPCADMILKFHKNSGKGSLRVTYEKYLMPAYRHVARIKPIEMLPV